MKVADNPPGLLAQGLALETIEASRTDNPYYRITSDSLPLTEDEVNQLERRFEGKSKKAFNTVSICKLDDDKWMYRRLTWIEGSWSETFQSFEQMMAVIFR